MERIESALVAGNNSVTQALFDLGKQLLEKARNGETSEVRNLMSSGAPFTADWLGTSPLHMAAANGHVETCEVLLRAGCSRDARTKVDKTPLHLASYEGHTLVVELLLKHGSVIDSKDMLMMTPLHWAVEKGHTEVIQILLQWGASIESLSKFDKTPIDIAIEAERTDIVHLIQDYLVNPVAVKNAVASLESANQASNSKELTTVVVGHRLIPKIKKTISPLPKPIRRVEKDQVLSALEVLEEATGDSHVSQQDTIQFLQTQGIQVHESTLQDDGAIVTSALQTGHSITLSDAGKLALKAGIGDNEKIIILEQSGVNSVEEEAEKEKLQIELENMKRQAEKYKIALIQKEREAEEYKKRLNEITPMSETETITDDAEPF